MPVVYVIYSIRAFIYVHILIKFMLLSRFHYIVLSVVDTYPELFQREIFSLVDAIVVDKYYLLSLTSESTVCMEITSRLWHKTVYGILLSNTTDDLVNCTLDIVHKTRVELFTALHFQLNALQVSIRQNVKEIHTHHLQHYVHWTFDYCQ